MARSAGSKKIEKYFHPLEQLAFASMSFENRVQCLAAMCRNGVFGEINCRLTDEDRYAEREPTMAFSRAREIVDLTNEPRGKRRQFAEALREEYRRQLVLVRERQYRQRKVYPSVHTYGSPLLMPYRDHWQLFERQRMIRPILKWERARKLPGEDSIRRLAFLLRDSSFATYSFKDSLLSRLSPEMRNRVKGETTRQRELSEERKTVEPSVYNATVVNFDAVERLPLRKKRPQIQRWRFLVLRALQRAGAINANGRVIVRLYDHRQEDISFGIHQRDIYDVRKIDGAWLMLVKPWRVYNEARDGYDEKHRFRYLYYVVGKLFGRVRISDKTDTVEEALDYIKRAPVKKAIEQHRRVEINWDREGFIVWSKTYRRSKFVPFKTAERRNPYQHNVFRIDCPARKCNNEKPADSTEET